MVEQWSSHGYWHGYWHIVVHMMTIRLGIMTHLIPQLQIAWLQEMQAGWLLLPARVQLLSHHPHVTSLIEALQPGSSHSLTHGAVISRVQPLSHLWCCHIQGPATVSPTGLSHQGSSHCLTHRTVTSRVQPLSLTHRTVTSRVQPLSHPQGCHIQGPATVSPTGLSHQGSSHSLTHRTVTSRVQPLSHPQDCHIQGPATVSPIGLSMSQRETHLSRNSCQM